MPENSNNLDHRIFIDNTVFGYEHYFENILKNKLFIYSPEDLEKIINKDDSSLFSDIYPITKKDIFIIRSKVKIKKDKAKQLPGFIGSTVSGSDHLDLDWLQGKGVDVYCATGCNSRSVFNYIVGVLVKLNNDFKLDLFNKKITFGIIGYGNIGKLVANWLSLFDIKIKVYDPYINIINNNKSNLIFVDNLNDLSDSDIISIHCSLTKSSIGLVNNCFLKNLKKGSILINSARGEVINQADVINNNHIIYIFDAWPNEPNISKELIEIAYIATPHIAGHSFNGKINGLHWVYHELVKSYRFKHISMPKFNKNSNNKNNKLFLDNINNISCLEKIDFDSLIGLSEFTEIIKSSIKNKNNISSVFKSLRSRPIKREDL